jgi:thiamine-monophosphate kinase
VSARVEAAALPVDACAALLGDEALALHGGEDYQLLLAVPPAAVDEVRRLAGGHRTAIAAIGTFAPGPARIMLRGRTGERPLAPHSHEHFARGRERG